MHNLGSKVASPFVALVVLTFVVAYSQFLDESHHDLEFLVHEIAVVIGEHLTSLGGRRHLSVDELRERRCEGFIRFGDFAHIHNVLFLL